MFGVLQKELFFSCHNIRPIKTNFKKTIINPPIVISNILFLLNPIIIMAVDLWITQKFFIKKRNKDLEFKQLNN